MITRQRMTSVLLSSTVLVALFVPCSLAGERDAAALVVDNASIQEAPFELEDGETLKLRIFIDKSVLEVFANGRQCITQRLYPSRKDSKKKQLRNAISLAFCLQPI